MTFPANSKKLKIQLLYSHSKVSVSLYFTNKLQRWQCSIRKVVLTQKPKLKDQITDGNSPVSTTSKSR